VILGDLKTGRLGDSLNTGRFGTIGIQTT